MNLGFYLLIFQFTTTIGEGTGWGKYQFFVFLATTLFVNSIVQAFFMPNCEEFSELIRTGGLDFALLKPIDTQFLISLQQDRLVGAVEFRFRDLPADLFAGQLAPVAWAGADGCCIRCTWLAAWRSCTA